MTIDDFPMIQSAISSLKHLVNIRLSVDSEGVDTTSFAHIDNDLLTGSKLKRVKMDMCARTTFFNVTKSSHVEQLSIVWCQMQELTHLLQYSPCLSTLKATICGLNDGKIRFRTSFPISQPLQIHHDRLIQKSRLSLF